MKTTLADTGASRLLAELLVERARLSAIIESAPEGILVADERAAIVLSNPAAQTLLGEDAEPGPEHPLRTRYRLLYPDGTPYEPRDFPLARSALSGESVRNLEAVITFPDGARRDLLLNSAPLRDPEGALTGGILMFQDVTKSKEMERESRRLLERLEQETHRAEVLARGLSKAKELSDALNAINAKVNSTLDFEEIMQRVVVESAEALKTETACILINEGGGWVCKYGYGVMADTIGETFSNSEAILSVIATRSGRPVIVQDSHRDVRVNNSVRDRFGITSLLVVPLVTKNNIVGSLCFNHVGVAAGYGEDEVDFARKLAASVALALENASLYQTQRGISEALQESLVTVPRRIEGVEFGYMYRSATQAAKVGGDLYDIFELEGGKVCGLVGDVSGKGVQAATFASLIRTTIKAYAYQDASPASIMTRTNEVLTKAAPGPVFATVFLCVLDVRTGRLAYCSAGHPPALLRHTDGHCECLQFQSPVIGAFPEKTYREGTAVLESGDILLLYSDGVTEARRNGELFREDRLARLVCGSAGLSARQLPGEVFEALIRFTGGTLLDDVALLAIALSRP